MSADDDNAGYGQPPSRTRFKPGQSGNPRGRPKGSKNFGTAILDELNDRIAVQENGRRKRISKRDAIAKQLINRAVGGDLRAQSLLLNEARPHEAGATEEQSAPIARPEDRAIMEGILRRMRQALAAEQTDHASPPNDTPTPSSLPASSGTPSSNEQE